MNISKKIARFFASGNKLELLHSRLVIPLKQKRAVRNHGKCRFRYAIKPPEIVVSLTSYPKRFATLPDMLKSLMHQTWRPDRIVVYLDCRKEELTRELEAMRLYGISYRFVEENLKPHLKYFHAMQDFPDALVITVDDDIIYTADLVETLMNSWMACPDCVHARRVHKMAFGADGTLKPYDDWTFECKALKCPSDDLFATGVGGVLYPPHIFDESVFDAAKIKELCLENDDIWLKWHELRLGVKVAWAENSMVHPPVVEGSQSTSLFSDNVGHRHNDVLIGRMQEKVHRAIRFPGKT